MALKQVDKEKLKSTYGLDVEKLIAVIKDENEVDYAVPDGSFFKPEDLEARDTNKIAEGKKAGETIGETKGKELASKAFKKKFALADDVSNDIDKVVEAVNTKINKGDTGLQEQIGLLQKDKERLEGEVAAERTKLKQHSFDTDLISHFPASRTADLNDKERLSILKGILAFEEDNGKQVVKRNGEILRDKNTQNPITPQQAIADYFTERKWTGGQQASSGGRGGENNAGAAGGGSGIKKRSEFVNKWLTENPGKNDISPECQSALEAHAKDIPDFDYYA